MRWSFGIGLLIGLATGLWMWGEYAMGLHTTHASAGRFTGFISAVFPILGMVWALRRVRRKTGELGFRSGMGHVVAVSLAATISMTLMSALYVGWLHPGWLETTGISTTTFLLQSATGTLLGGIVIGVIAIFFLRTSRISSST
jgi:hypothetical protein